MTARIVWITCFLFLMLIPCGNWTFSCHASPAVHIGSFGFSAEDYVITTSGGSLVITDVSGNSDTLFITASGTDIVFDVPARTYTLDGGPISSFPVTISLSGINAVLVNPEAGGDVIDLNIPNLAMPDLTINGGTGNDVVYINSDVNFNTDASLNIDLQDDDASPGIDRVVFNTGVNVALGGYGDAIIRVSRNVVFMDNSQLITEYGNLTIEANQQASATSGSFSGIGFEGSYVGVTESGALTVKGKGGDSGSSQIGILLTDYAELVGGDSLTNIVIGTGGLSSGNTNIGVHVTYNSAISSNGGDLEVSGYAGGTGAGQSNCGVLLEQQGYINVLGSSVVTVEGTGGNTSGANNCGVLLDGYFSYISSSTGNVFVTGEGGGSGVSAANNGISLLNQSYISTGASGNIVVEGTGGLGTSGNNIGVNVEEYSSIYTYNGHIEIVGIGGGSGSSSYDPGLSNRGGIQSTGSGNISIYATGGPSAGGYQHGIICEGYGASIATYTGNLTIQGVAGGSAGASTNIGVYITLGAWIAGGTMGSDTIQGTGGPGLGSFNYGVYIESSGTSVITNGSDLTIIGQGGGMSDSESNYGVFIADYCVVAPGGAGNLLMQGTGGAATGSQNGGVYITYNADITSAGGNIHVIGVSNGTGSGANNFGVFLEQQGNVSASGSGSVTVEGTGGNASGSNNCGVILDGYFSYISSSTGNVIVIGQGGGSGTSTQNIGVNLLNQSYISTGGSGNVTVDGTGGQGTSSYNHGVRVDFYSAIYTYNGSVDVTGIGGGTGASSDNHGILNQGGIQSTGGGNINLNATGGSSEGSRNYGLFCDSYGASVSCYTGTLTIDGQGGGAAGAGENIGVYIFSGALVSGGTSGITSIQGTGGPGSGSHNYGVCVLGSGSTVNTTGSDMNLIGQGGGVDSSGFDFGVYVSDNAVVVPGGSGNLLVQGTGGAATGDQNGGVYVTYNAFITTSGGNLHVIGESEGTGSGSYNFGVLLEQQGYISGSGSGTVTVEGVGGITSGANNYGVLLDGYFSYISSSSGNIFVSGDGGGTGTSAGNIGVYLLNQSSIYTGDFGNITIEGFGGEGSGDFHHGVSVEVYSAIYTYEGNIDILGIGGGSGSSSDNYGLMNFGGIQVTGGGEINIDATGGPSEGNHNYGLYCNGSGSSIATYTGSLSIEGYGGGSADASENIGVYFSDAPYITGANYSSLSILGAGGPSSGSGNHGIYFYGYGTTIQTNGGDMFFTGIEGGGSTGLGIFHTYNSTISSSSFEGNVHLVANSMDIEATVTCSTLDTVFIHPYTAGTEITLGPADDPVGGPLKLSDDELDLVSSIYLYIGDPATGTITVDSNITRTSSTFMALISQEDVIFANGSINTNHSDLHLDPGVSPFGVYPNTSGEDVITGIGTLTFGSDLVIGIEGIIPDTDYEQMNIEGLIELTGVDLIVEGSYAPMIGDSFVIVQNDGPENIIGTFVGLAEGDTIYNFLTAGTDAIITYLGNTGNDAVIRVVVACLLPEVPVVSASQDTACAGEMITLTIDAGDLGDAVDWYWYSEGCGTTPEGVGTSIMVSPLVSTTYYVRGEGGCVSEGSCADIDIIINAIPDPAILQDAPDPCYYTSNFFQPVAPEIPGATYTWDFGIGAEPATASGYGPHDVMYLAPGPKTVKLVIYPNESGAQCPDSSTIDFTIINCPGQILGKVFDDFFNPIASVHVLLYEDADTNGIADDDTPVRSIFTDSNGNIGMANLTPGHYVLVQNQPSGWTSLDDYDVTDDGDVVENIDSLDNLIPVSILPLEIDSMNTFIEKAIPGQITGAVFEDLNLNEVPDPGEGIADVLLKIFPDYNQDGSPDTIVPAYTGMTDAMGAFAFDEIPVGHYVIVETQPPGMASVKDFDASNDGDEVPNTDMQDDTIPCTLINMEIDAHNYFIDAPDCGLQVTNTNDDGIGSLRYALACATDGDTITFHPAMAGNAILITSAQVLIDKDVVFYSTLMPNVEIHSQITGLFEVPPTKEVEFSGIYIISGLSPGSTGAAFENFGSLILTDVRVTRNPLFMSGEYLIRNHPGSELTIDGTCQIQEN